MGLAVTFVSGPRRSGKSAAIRAMIDHVFKKGPHYLRLVKCGSDKVAPARTKSKPSECGVASARWLEYDCDRIFEILPEALATIHRKDRYGSVLIEADADPTLRCAYPYDHRLFVMPIPTRVVDVFRHPDEAAAEFRRVLDDTTAFASEIFGLFSAPPTDDVDPSEDRSDLTAAQMRGFLNSPLADELATRIQLQPPYHGLVESDVIVVNTGIGEAGLESRECLRRVERLLTRMRRLTEPRAQLFLSDLRDPTSAPVRKLLKALRPFCDGGR